jgi:hypothetical protein
MSKKNECPRLQREFFFVFNSANQMTSSMTSLMGESESSSGKNLSGDIATAHREKLIAELREFGC